MLKKHNYYILRGYKGGLFPPLLLTLDIRRALGIERVRAKTPLTLSVTHFEWLNLILCFVCKEKKKM